MFQHLSPVAESIRLNCTIPGTYCLMSLEYNLLKRIVFISNVSFLSITYGLRFGFVLNKWIKYVCQETYFNDVFCGCFSLKEVNYLKGVGYT